MEYTKEEVALRALRMIGVVASDEPATADQMQGALNVLDGIWSEVRSEAQATWDVVTGTIPEAFIPLASLLAAEMAAEYQVPAPMTRTRAKLRLLAVIRPDDRPRRKYDDCHDYGFTPCR